jgi:GNAT superfamily N-acetyltransferase
MSITLRDASGEDQAFLCEVYGSTRAQELSVVPWSYEQKQAFVEMQFKAQDSYYREQFPQASYQVILENGGPVGRIYVLREEQAIRILDITLLPQHRSTGIGTSLLRDLVSEADSTGKALNIWVEPFNPSLRLFERLGFRKVQEENMNCLLEYRGTSKS